MINQVLFGDCRDTLNQIIESGTKARMCVTSPPYYGLRDYGGEGNQIGLETSPEAFVDELVKVDELVEVDELVDVVCAVVRSTTIASS